MYRPRGDSIGESLYHLDKFHIHDPLVCGDTLVYQAGRLFCSEKTVIETHLHLDWLELTVATEGCGTVVTNGEPTKIGAGDIYLSFPADRHSILPDKTSPLKYDFLSYMPTDRKFSDALGEFMLSNTGTEKRVIRNERISSLVSAAISETDGKRGYADEMLGAILREITVLLLRESEPDKDRIPDSAEQMCYRVMNYIDTHIYSIKSLGVLSEFTSYNYSYLSHLFKSTSGITLADYYKRRKMETAHLLVKDGELKLSEIASLLSYSSVYAFSKAYKAYFNVSPRFEKT